DEPMKVAVSGAVALGAGNAHTCAITADGLVCWGSNASGQLGVDLSTSASSDPLSPAWQAGLGMSFIAVDGGREHTCALSDDGQTHCWGANGNGQVDGSASGA